MDFEPARIWTTARKRIGIESYRYATGFYCQGKHDSIRSSKKTKDSL